MIQVITNYNLSSRFSESAITVKMLRLLIVLFLFGCNLNTESVNMLPRDAEIVLREHINSKIEVVNYTIASSQRGNPDNFAIRADEVWCIVISPPITSFGQEESHYFVYRLELLWSVRSVPDYLSDSFLALGCDNWEN